ncbi:hypothetical protein C798_27180 [Herbaspirillum rubrisubalbicans Os34]|uniref:Uncharacterized protein n=1 Tax=Herbaspirillum rubrisubalbicans Os34 TaxID=1235827 RepID=A0A6M4A053_9BURK|nr:hypothetical protein [Herbaspirillum rubrisubalbicans]QJQ03793.1 hypothetical protein C798_27180 [Herbaspirillum rubrisubalbicans Os34]
MSRTILRTIFLGLACVMALAMCGAGYWFGRGIPFGQQWPLFEALRNTAAIIFAVVGAWLAIIYPERLRLSFGKKAEGGSSGGNIGLLLVPAVYSTIILVILLFIGITVPMLKQIPYLLEHIEICRGISFAVLTALTIWQAAIVIMTIDPADMVKDSADREAARQQYDAGRDKLRRRIP